MSTHPYENLISIIAVSSTLIVFALFSEFGKQYPPVKIDIFAEKQAHLNVQGYTRPGSVNQQLKQNSNAVVDPSQKINLLANLSDEQKRTLTMRFEQAATLLHAKQYEYAITALEEVIRIQPNMPEAYVNMGFAYLGLEQFDTAILAFDKTLQLRRDQINAYYGIAVAYEAKKEFESALGAMRAYIHLASPGDPYLPKARAAVWEWETQLGRNPTVENSHDSDNPHIARPIHQ